MNIQNSSLFKKLGFIDGKWIGAETKRTIPVNNPSTQELLGHIPFMGKTETSLAVTTANNAFKTWSITSVKYRSELLNEWYKLIIKHKDDLAHILTSEQGKVLTEAKGETLYGASFVQWYAEQAKRLNGIILPSYLPNSQIQVTKEPVGVVGAITPWNFPIGMITRKIAPALAAGCTVVIKPSELTPFTAIALTVLAEEAGFPPGVINLVMGDAPEIGNVLTGHPDVAKITFTGSTAVGKHLMRQSADTVKKVSLELGGNAPFIVLDDADLDSAVKGCIISKFRNSGQTCVCANRILVQISVYDKFIEKLTVEVNKIKVADGFVDGAGQGPLINTAAVDKVVRHVKETVEAGGKIVIGGNKHALGGTFFEPTIIKDVPVDCVFNCEETFGPVAPIIKFDTDEEALTIANNTRSGLAAYFFTSNAVRISKFVNGLQTGMVGVNTGLLSSEHIPFGGVKESGLGREGGELGIDEFINYKYALISQS